MNDGVGRSDGLHSAVPAVSPASPSSSHLQPIVRLPLLREPELAGDVVLPAGAQVHPGGHHARHSQQQVVGQQLQPGAHRRACAAPQLLERVAQEVQEGERLRGRKM